MATVKTLNQKIAELNGKKASLASKSVMLCSKVAIKDPVARKRRFDEIAFNIQKEQNNIDMQLAKLLEQKNKMMITLQSYQNMYQQNGVQIQRLTATINVNRSNGRPIKQLSDKVLRLQKENAHYEAEIRKISQRLG